MGRPLPLRPEIEADYDSDSSTDMMAENTVGNIPMEWYDDLPHIGYDLNGQKIIKGERSDELDKFLSNADDPDAWRSVRDELMQQNIVLTQDELEIIKRIQSGHYTQVDYDPYEPMVEFFSSKTMEHPVTNAPEPKSRFVPSKWEAKRVIRMVRAIREGRVHSRRRQDPSKKDGDFYHLWDDTKDKAASTDHVTALIPAPKMALPDHSESYNPPKEYLLDEDEEAAWKDAAPEDRERNYMPSKFDTLRHVPAYRQFIQERYERCMNLYLSPRIRKHRLNIDPESLIPKLPDPKDLEPFPSRLALTFRGHTGRIRSFSVDPTGMWLISGGDDGLIKLWMLSTGRCLRTWSFPKVRRDGQEASVVVSKVAWNPNRDVCLFAASVEDRVLLISPPKVADLSVQLSTESLVNAGFSLLKTSGDDKVSIVDWEKPSAQQATEGYLAILRHPRSTSGITWHRRGDYFACLCSLGDSMTVLIHQLSKHQTQRPFQKTKGAVQQVTFHPTKPHFFVVTQRYVRVYNLQQQQLIKTLQPGVKWISSVDVHPQGDNVLIGAYDRRTCWFDMDLSSKPYKTLRYHKKAVRSVAYHRNQPLFASASDDGTLQVFHGMVYNDLMQNPLIVPVKILRGHQVKEGLGVLYCEFHPTQPWLLSSGADQTIRLWC